MNHAFWLAAGWVLPHVYKHYSLPSSFSSGQNAKLHKKKSMSKSSGIQLYKHEEEQDSQRSLETSMWIYYANTYNSALFHFSLSEGKQTGELLPLFQG